MKLELRLILSAGLAALSLSACDLSGKRQASLQEATSAPAPSAMSPEQFRKALRSASVILVDRLPTQVESDKAAEGLAGYETVIRQFLDDPGFLKVALPVPDAPTSPATITGAIKRYHDAFFESSGPAATLVLANPAANQMTAAASLPANFLDANESTNMALYIIKNNLDYRTILTMNQCVNSRLELGPCSAFIPKATAPTEGTRTWQQVLDMQAAEAAGVLSNRKFLAQFDAPFYFRRVHKAFNFFACRTYPDPDDLGMPASDMSTTVYRWDEMNKPVQTERCYECHSNLNPRTAMFFPFDRNGFFRGGTSAAHFNQGSFAAQYPNNTYPNNVRPQTPDNAVATLDVLLKNSTATRPALYGGQPITRLRDYAVGLSNSKHFKTCMVQRFANFLLGYEPRTPLGADLTPIVGEVETTKYNVKEIIVKIATSQAFLLRQ
ncbi:MAG: hypothetical protein K2X47_10770 [Bdellovibrionales bacterium]|nr:hypothetical protein [Bdellovibrionales bacterium]